MKNIEKPFIQSFEDLCRQVMQAGEAVGMAVAIVDKTGQTLYQNCFGLRDAEKKLPIDENTIFGLASVSKSITCLSVMQLAEGGFLDILAPVRQYIPELRHPAITCQQLMSHSAGFLPADRTTLYSNAEKLGLSQEKDGDFAFSVPLALAGRADMLETLNAMTRFTGRPGENFSYSNHSFSVLGDIVRQFGGSTTLPAYIRDNIMTPLGMSRSGGNFLWEDDNVAVLYQKQNGSMVGTSDLASGASSMFGSGGMRSTLADMKKYICMYLNLGKGLGGERILSAYGAREMMKPRIANGVNEYYGYGLARESLEDVTVVRHGGAMVGVSSEMAFSLENGLGVMVLCNTSGVGVRRVAKAAMRMAMGLEPAPEKAEPAPVRWSERLSDSLCGKYFTTETGEYEITREGGLFTLKLGDMEAKGHPINDYVVLTHAGHTDLPISAYLDEAGEVWAINAGLRLVPKVTAVDNHTK